MSWSRPWAVVAAIAIVALAVAALAIRVTGAAGVPHETGKTRESLIAEGMRKDLGDSATKEKGSGRREPGRIPDAK